MKIIVNFGNEIKKGDEIIKMIENASGFVFIGKIFTRNPISKKEKMYLAFEDGETIRMLNSNFNTIGKKTLSFSIYKKLLIIGTNKIII